MWTQCSIILHLIDICFLPCICLWQILQIQTCVCVVVGTVFVVVVVVCPLQLSLSTNPGCPGPESSVPVSSGRACPISLQVTDNWDEPCNRTGEVHPLDPFHTLDNLKNQFVSIAFCKNSAVYTVRNGAVIGLPVVVSIKGFPHH